MIDDLRATRGRLAAPDAVVVVGAGPAGIALAERLSAARRPVVLLESGGDVAADATGGVSAQDLNVGIATGLEYPGMTLGRARVLGGTGQLWHGQCTRMHPLDLQRRSWVAHSGWPISMAELDRYYPEAERWFEVTGLGYGGDRWQEHPGLRPLEWDSRRLLHDFTEYTPAPLTGSEHRAGLVADPHVSVYVNATVTRVIVGESGVTGVEVADPDGTRVVVETSTVVLCGGAIENARLLQLSDPAGVGLGQGREVVGRFLQDHPVVTTADLRSTDPRVLQDRYVALYRGKRKLFPKVRLAPAAQRAHELLDANAVFVHEHRRRGVDALRRVVAGVRERRMPERPLRAVTELLAGAPSLAHDAFRRVGRGLPTGARPSRVSLQVWMEQEPDPDSRVTLAAQTDELGLRRAEVHWRVGQREIETSRALTRWVAADLRRMGVAEVVESEVMSDDDAWRSSVRDAYHPAGTTRMSLLPADGVVDTDLQVHGVRGLNVVGSSVFPVCGYANPTLTIVALALRLGDRLGARGTSD